MVSASTIPRRTTASRSSSTVARRPTRSRPSWTAHRRTLADPGPLERGARRIRADREPWRPTAPPARDRGRRLRGLRLAIDCANGSASDDRAGLFRSLGRGGDRPLRRPNGSNINDGCGSTHPERLAETVAAAGLDVGLAFDGDADRLIAIDERGELVDGDAVMGICALGAAGEGTLRNSVLVATVMSNGGLERAVRAAGGTMIRTPVGDRHVFEAMEREDAVLGGEQSGHVIFRDRSTTGDGLLTGIELVPCRPGRRACPLRARRPHSEVAAGDDKLTRPPPGGLAGRTPSSWPPSSAPRF
jgi:hypothetical protein